MSCLECDEAAGEQNFCLVHYLRDSQDRPAVNVHFLTAAVPPVAAAAHTAPPLQVLAPQDRIAHFARFTPSSPPLHVLFCSYQT